MVRPPFSISEARRQRGALISARYSRLNAARVVVPVGLTLLLAGCLASLAPIAVPAAQPIFDPTQFFAGHTHGEGRLDVRIGADRTVRVDGVGRTETDGRFRLDQTITFGDGSVETRVWYLRRVDATHFTATLSDAKGEVQAETNGARFHLRYLLRSPAVYMEQWLTLNADARTVDNQAQVTVLGVPWARLSETITQRDSAAP